MAPSDNGPSENEDFDVTVDKAPKASEKSSKKVAVSGAETGEPESVVEPTEPQNEAEAVSPEEDNFPEEAPEATPEPEAEEPRQPVKETDQGVEQPLRPVDTSTRKVSRGRLLLELLLIVLVIGLGLWSWSLYSDRNNLKSQVTNLKANPQVAVKEQSDALISRVGRLIDLPKGETPTIASVSDADAARKQSTFFNSAQNGDKVLMYVKAGEAILYRPSTNKIILVAPLTFNNNNSSTTKTPATTSKTPATTSKTTTTTR